MNAAGPEKRAEELRQELAEHNRRYYVLDEPTVGDDVYDALLDELRAIEADHPKLRTPDSPTQRVGAPPLSRFAPGASSVPVPIVVVPQVSVQTENRDGARQQHREQADRTAHVAERLVF